MISAVLLTLIVVSCSYMTVIVTVLLPESKLENRYEKVGSKVILTVPVEIASRESSFSKKSVENSEDKSEPSSSTRSETCILSVLPLATVDKSKN